MSPLPVYDTHDAIPEADRDDFAEHDGKWRHKVEIEAAVEKRKRARLLDEKKEEERLRREAEKRAAELEQAADARSKGISEEELRKIRDAEVAARKPIEDERDRYKAENRKLKLTDRVQALYLANGGMSDRVEDAMLVLERRTDLGDADGIVWKDKEGGITADTPEVFFRRLKGEKPWLFQGTGSSGSGASESNGQGGSENSVTPAQALERKRQTMPGSI
jgi:hypothetical protein